MSRSNVYGLNSIRWYLLRDILHAPSTDEREFSIRNMTVRLKQIVSDGIFKKPCSRFTLKKMRALNAIFILTRKESRADFPRFSNFNHFTLLPCIYYSRFCFLIFKSLDENLIVFSSSILSVKIVII